MLLIDVIDDEKRHGGDGRPEGGGGEEAAGGPAEVGRDESAMAVRLWMDLDSIAHDTASPLAQESLNHIWLNPIPPRPPPFPFTFF